MKMTPEEVDEAILASLKKLGPSRPSVIADDAGLDPMRLKDRGKALLAAGLIKAEGATSRRLWALPGQAIDADAVLPIPASAKRAKRARAAKKKANSESKRRYMKHANGLPRAAAKGDPRIRAREAIDAIRAAQLPGSIATSFASLRFAFDAHLSAVTSAREALFGEARMAIKAA